MQLSIQSIQSISSGDFLNQLISCLNQIDLNIEDSNWKRRIIKITVFTSNIDNNEYSLKMSILNHLLGQNSDIQAPVSLVSQPPFEDKVMMEAWMMDYQEIEMTFTFKRSNQISVLQIDNPEYSLLISSQYSEKLDTFKQNALETFNLLDTSLAESNFNYNEIVRQWNYIENITMFDSVSDKNLQNYQTFNDLRSLFYGKSDFLNGYPSATGIGIENGGCTIEIIALKEKKGNDIHTVTNSHQVDAHNYSTTVLIGNAIDEINKISTPKFERGKSILFREDGFLFISGTASIIGEETVFPDNVEKQTLTTFQNIDHLISVNNLNQCKIGAISIPKLTNFRVYLKNESDYPIVKSLCDKHFGILGGIYVKADICRNNLLVEIEANYHF